METVAAAVARAAQSALTADLSAATGETDLGQVAMNRWLTPQLAEQVYRRSSGEALVELAANEVTPSDLLARLIGHPDDTVRDTAQRNVSCPFSAFAAHGDVPLAAHPHCPEFVVVAMLRGGSATAEHVDLALSHPALPEQERRRLAASSSLPQLLNLLGNPSLTQDEAGAILFRTRQHSPATALSKWCRNPNADSDWLGATYESYQNSSAVVTAIAANPSTPAHVLRRIHPVRLLDTPALLNPALPAGCMLAVLDHTGSPDVIDDLLRNPSITISVLARIHTSHVHRDHLYDLLLAHAVDAAQVHVALAALDSWNGNVAALLEASFYISR